MSKHFLSVLPLLLVASCSTVGPDFEAPAQPAVDSYRMAGDIPRPEEVMLVQRQSVGLGWWKIFQSPEIDALVDQALENSPTLDIADAALARANASEGAVRGKGVPQADVTASMGRERINTAAFGIKGFPSPTINLYSVGSAVSFDLDLFGKQKRRVENARAHAEAEGYRTDAAYLTLTGQVVVTAIRLAALRSQLTELDEIIAGDRKTLDMIQRGVDAGGEPRAAINTSEAQLAEDEARRPPLLYQIDATRHELALLVGKAPPDWSAPDIALTDIALPDNIPVSLPSELVRHRPDILAAEADLHAATAAIGIAEADRYPDLSLDAAFAFAALSPDELFQYESSGWSVGPAVSLPLLRGGTLKARQQMVIADAQAADARYRQTVLSAFIQIADLFSAIARDQALIDAQSRASNIAMENVRLATVSYENGAGSLLSVIDAQRQAQRARLALVDAQAQLREDAASIIVASGWSSMGEGPRDAGDLLPLRMQTSSP